MSLKVQRMGSRAGSGVGSRAGSSVGSRDRNPRRRRRTPSSSRHSAQPLSSNDGCSLSEDHSSVSSSSSELDGRQRRRRFSLGSDDLRESWCSMTAKAQTPFTHTLAACSSSSGTESEEPSEREVVERKLSRDESVAPEIRTEMVASRTALNPRPTFNRRKSIDATAPLVMDRRKSIDARTPLARPPLLATTAEETVPLSSSHVAKPSHAATVTLRTASPKPTKPESPKTPLAAKSKLTVRSGSPNNQSETLKSQPETPNPRPQTPTKCVPLRSPKGPAQKSAKNGSKSIDPIARPRTTTQRKPSRVCIIL